MSALAGSVDFGGGIVERNESLTENRRFGKYLRRVREGRRLSLDSVEEMTVGYPERITKSHLSRIENGQAVPTFPRLFALSQIYGVPIACLAERFEMDLRRSMVPIDVAGQSEDSIIASSKELRARGRYVEALQLYDELVDRWSNDRTIDQTSRPCYIEVRLERLNCLAHLGRYSLVKEDSENLLGHVALTPDQKAWALQLFAMCCYRLQKYTVALMALESVESERDSISENLIASLIAIKANLLGVTGRHEEAIRAYRDAIRDYDRMSNPFEACRARLNLCSVLIEIGNNKSAKRQLADVLREAEKLGFDRQLALAHSNLAVLAYREGNRDATEGHCLRSNAIARPREYYSVVFRNCYYLWRLALDSNDNAAIKTHERSLRTYLVRIEESLSEADEYRAHLAGSESC